MRIIESPKYDFNDVLLLPKRSDLNSRNEVELNRQMKFKYGKQSFNRIPIFAANMDVVDTVPMAKKLSELGLCTTLHKHHPTEVLYTAIRDYNEASVWCSIGATDKDFEKLRELEKSTIVRHICIDVANGYTIAFEKFVNRVREKFPDALIMAGNVCTPEMVQTLILEGADIVKVGIGPGKVCRTRTVTGVGYPQLSAIIECADVAHGLGGHICADGGCSTPGDVVKAFAGGADFVMLGSMFAGTDECEGEWQVYREIYKYEPSMLQHLFNLYNTKNLKEKWIPTNNKELNNTVLLEKKEKLKFYGMSSYEAMKKYGGLEKEYRASEGAVEWVDYKGPVADVVKEILGGLRSACTYVGAATLKDLPKCATFVVKY